MPCPPVQRVRKQGCMLDTFEGGHCFSLGLLKVRPSQIDQGGQSERQLGGRRMTVPPDTKYPASFVGSLLGQQGCHHSPVNAARRIASRRPEPDSLSVSARRFAVAMT